MAVICYVTPSLFPTDWTESSINFWWRALSSAEAGDDVTVLFQACRHYPPETLNRIAAFYRKQGIRLVMSPRLSKGMPDDLRIAPGSPEAPQVYLHQRLVKLHAANHFDTIHLSIQDGLPLRTLQARKAGLDFQDVLFILHIDDCTLIDRFLQRRKDISHQQLRRDFAELECVKLAPRLATCDLKFAQFSSDILAWELSEVEHWPLLPPSGALQPGLTPKAGTSALICSNDRSSYFTEYLSIRRSALDRPSTWNIFAPNRFASLIKPLAGKLKLKTHFPAQIFILGDLLRRQRTPVIAPTPWISARLLWLACQGVPIVYPAELQESLPALAEHLPDLAFDSQDTRSMLQAIRASWNQPSSPEHFLPAKPEPHPTPSSRIPQRIESSPHLDTPITLAVSHYNLKGLLSKTLQALDHQTYPKTRVIVVDDGSNEEASLRDWRACQEQFPKMEFVELAHEGYWNPRNHAIFSTPDPLIGIVDGDNLPIPEMAEHFVRAMERNPATDAFSCFITAFRQVGDEQNLTFQSTNCPVGGDPVSGALQNVFGDTNSVFRTESIKRIGGYRANFNNPYADWDIFYRLIKAGLRLDVIPKVLLHYRSRQNSMIRQSNSFLSQHELVNKVDFTQFQLDEANRRRLALALHQLQF